jgi:hypothetical protein
LFSPKQKAKPGPKGPTAELIRAVVEMKQRNPTWGCPQIADQINLAFGTSINKDVVRRILAAHYRPQPGSDGPSWLTFLGHTKDSLWSLDLFRCESMLLRTHWVLVVMDHYTRRIIGIEWAATEFQPKGAHKPGFISLAETLSRALSNARCRVSVRIRHAQVQIYGCWPPISA